MRQDSVKTVLYATGLSNGALALYFGVSRQTIHRWVVQNFIPEKYTKKLVDLQLQVASGTSKGSETPAARFLVEEIEDRIDSANEWKGAIESLTTEELVAELTKRGWRVSLAKIPAEASIEGSESSES